MSTKEVVNTEEITMATSSLKKGIAKQGVVKQPQKDI
jgi:hypothetical protein